MSAMDSDRIEYLLAHLEQRLAEDERTSELGVHAHAAGETVVLTGTVATRSRLEAIGTVAREVLDDRPFSNDVTVVDLSDSEGMERLS